MSILYVLHSLDIGGAQKITVDTAVTMKTRGHNIYVAGPRGELEEVLLNNGIRYFRINIDAKRKTPASFLLIFLSFLYIIFKYKIDIIHTIHRWPNFICFFVCLVSGSKLIWTDQNILVGNRFLTLYRDRVISVSNACKRHLMEYFHIPEEKITVIYNTVKPIDMPGQNEIYKFLDKTGIKSGGRVISTIANLVERKGHKYLLMAIPIILSKIQNVHFIFAGYGNLRQDLTDMAKKLNILSNIHFLGQRDDVPVIIAASEIMVLPSLWEGFPLVVLEAFSLGKPVVVTNVGGNKELVTDNKTGFIVEAKDYQRLADAIIRILSDDEKRKEMGIKAKELVNREFNFDQMISKIESVYKDSMEGSVAR